MPGKSVDLVLKILGDSSSAQKATKEASGSVAKMQRTVGKLTIPAAAVATAVTAVGISAVKSASRLQQAFGAVDSVFGKNAKQVKAWARTSDQALGLSAAAYSELASIIGAQLKSAGVPIDQAAAKTQELIKRGADLAATFGGTTAQAVEALTAALRGEADPAERLGLSLNQTRVNAVLAAKGQAHLTGKALSAAKAQAILDLVTQQSAGAIGQFGRESDSAAGSAQIAAAKWENAKATLGEQLLPAVTDVTEALGGMAGWMGKNATATQVMIGVVGTLAAGILILNGAIKAYNAAATAAVAVNEFLRGSTIATAVGVYAISAAEAVATAATWAWNAALAVFDALNPFGWVVLAVVAVVALVAAIILAYKHSARFQAIVKAVGAAVATAAKAIGSAFAAVWRVIAAGARFLWSSIVTAFNAVRAVVVGVARGIMSVFGPVFAVIGALARLYATVVKLVFVAIYTVARLAAQVIIIAFQIAFALVRIGAQLAGRVIVAAFNALAGPVRAVAGAIGSVFRAGFAVVQRAASAMAGFVRAIIAPLIGPARSVANAISSVFRTAFAGISAAARTASSGISTAVNAVRTAFERVGAVAKTIGGKITAGLSGAKGVIDSITSAVQRLIDWLGKIKIPKIKIPGVGSFGGSSRMAVGVATRAAPGFPLSPAGPSLTRGAPSLRGAPTVTTGTGWTINVYGVLDGADAGRKIRAILRDDDRRRKGVRVQARTVTG